MKLGSSHFQEKSQYKTITFQYNRPSPLKTLPIELPCYHSKKTLENHFLYNTYHIKLNDGVQLLQYSHNTLYCNIKLHVYPYKILKQLFSTNIGNNLYNSLLSIQHYSYLLPEFTFSRMFRNFPLVISLAEKIETKYIYHYCITSVIKMYSRLL